MQNIKKIIRLLSLTALVGLPLFAQTPERGKLQEEVGNISTHLARLRQQQQSLSQQADSLARDIQRRKQQSPSLLQDRSLNAALRFSQTLADSMQQLQQEENRVDRLLRQKAEQLLKILNEEIARLANDGEKLKREKNSKQREQVKAELLECREWQRRCQALLEQPPPAIIIYEVEVKSEDSPETLRRKADFLRDQSDRLRREVKRLDGKIAEIKDETQVRERMTDFTDELALLDPNREGVSSSASSFGASRGDNSAAPSTDFDVERIASKNLTLPLSQFAWPGNVGDLSFDDLERWRSALDQQKKRRQAQADSLAQRARDIEQLIENQLKSAGEKRQ
ncbi:hypothetical protein L0337_29635 [candidate division KSB1 bacterium]|nr:hypothetical protein [candidate division KSB1 bacterium]